MDHTCKSGAQSEGILIILSEERLQRKQNKRTEGKESSPITVHCTKSYTSVVPRAVAYPTVHRTTLNCDIGSSSERCRGLCYTYSFVFSMRLRQTLSPSTERNIELYCR